LIYCWIMNNILDWVKQNKPFVILLGLVMVYWVWQNQAGMVGYQSGPSMISLESADYGMALRSKSEGNLMRQQDNFLPPVEPDRISDSAVRLVTRDANFSAQVNDVAQTLRLLEQKAADMGGFLVNSNTSHPEGASNGNLTVRVPADRLDEYLNEIRNAAVKVVSENITAHDITDEYEDVNEKLATYETTKSRLQALYNQATRIEDLLKIQQELINVQSQIDYLKGRQQGMEKRAELSLVTVYLGTDEFALPYSPEQPWRPEVVFKQAVRSLILNVRAAGSALIWLAVYSPVIVPVMATAWYLNRRRK
jgi:hypothetical protein